MEREDSTARELIERRIRHEVGVYNENLLRSFLGLVAADATRAAAALGNGWRVEKPRDDSTPGNRSRAPGWAFSHGRILRVVDDRQVETLDDELTPETGRRGVFLQAGAAGRRIA